MENIELCEPFHLPQGLFAMQKYIDLAASDSAMDYPQYFEFTEKLLAQGKTTGTNQSPEMIAYTQLNLKRMKRWNKTYTPSAAMREAVLLAKPMINDMAGNHRALVRRCCA